MDQSRKYKSRSSPQSPANYYNALRNSWFDTRRAKQPNEVR